MSHILVIAGTDSSGGAGLSRDITMATRLGCSVAPVVTAVTVQTHAALLACHPVPAEIIAAQLDAAFDQHGAAPKAVKIGMIGSAEAAHLLARILPPDLPVVLDPVLKSSSGGTLMTLDTLAPLLPRVTVLTPNLDESAQLSGLELAQDTAPRLAELSEQARLLQAKGAQSVLIKGGHGTGPQSIDHLFTKQGHAAFAARRLTRGKRGTGCSLATALACGLAQGSPLEQACAKAKAAVSDWLVSD